MYTSPTSDLGTGALTRGEGVQGVSIMGNSSSTSYKLLFDASKYNSTYGSSTTVTPLSESCFFCIKF